MLRWVFGIDSPWLVVGLRRADGARGGADHPEAQPRRAAGHLHLVSACPMALTGFTVTFAVTGLDRAGGAVVRAALRHPDRGHGARQLDDRHRAGPRARLRRPGRARATRSSRSPRSGATPWEAAHPSIRDALRAGLIPTINSMAAVGIVFIPGMMAGQILAGADPVTATGYQIVVMLMVAAATALGSVIALLLTYRRRFTADGVFLERGMRREGQ